MSISKNEMSKAEKRLSDNLKASLAKKEERERKTVNLYTFKKLGMDFFPPFLGVCDQDVLREVKDFAKENKFFWNLNVYRIGTFCAVDGKIKPCKPVLVLDKKGK